MGHIRPPFTRRAATLGASAALLLSLSVTTSTASAAQGEILGADRANAIDGSYLVVLKSGATSAAELTKQHGGKVKDTWKHALKGFAAKMTEDEARAMAADSRVAYVQQDATVKLLDTQPNPPSWGLDRIDQRDLPLSNSYTYDTTASNVTVYVIDTGIRTTHQTFGGRAVWGTNTVGDGNNTDCNGHGTHVAGTVGGSQYGVAKGVRLVAVKVLNCQGSGSTSGVVAGIDYVTQQHQPGPPAVANMSLGGGVDTALDQAVRNSIADGVTYAIASGNSNANACNFSPARVTEAITVNASTISDARASFSNFGTCTDIFAPGNNITSSWSTNDTATNTISGTSMAAPHVAGAAALWLATHTSDSPSAVATALINNSTPNKITNPGTGSPNRLLFTAPAGTPPPPPPPPPSGCTGTNATDVTIPDNTTVQSQITIAGCTGNASGTSTVEVHIQHTYIGDLVVSLVAPDGSAYVLHNRAGGSADNINTTYTRDLSSEVANGTWTLRVQDAATADFGKIDTWTLSLGGAAPPPPSCGGTNGTDVTIPDNTTVQSQIAVAGCSGNASATSKVEVHIQHTYIGDLVVTLVAPDGSAYVLHNRAGGSADNINTTYTRDLSSEVRNGTWTLRVQDAATIDTGKIDTWTLTL